MVSAYSLAVGMSCARPRDARMSIERKGIFRMNGHTVRLLAVVPVVVFGTKRNGSFRSANCGSRGFIPRHSCDLQSSPGSPLRLCAFARSFLILTYCGGSSRDSRTLGVPRVTIVGCRGSYRDRRSSGNFAVQTPTTPQLTLAAFCYSPAVACGFLSPRKLAGLHCSLGGALKAETLFQAGRCAT